MTPIDDIPAVRDTAMEAAARTPLLPRPNH